MLISSVSWRRSRVKKRRALNLFLPVESEQSICHRKSEHEKKETNQRNARTHDAWFTRYTKKRRRTTKEARARTVLGSTTTMTAKSSEAGAGSARVLVRKSASICPRQLAKNNFITVEVRGVRTDTVEPENRPETAFFKCRLSCTSCASL